MTNQRAFVQSLLESKFKEDNLRDLTTYLQAENGRIDNLIATSQAAADGATNIVNVYREEKQILAMEEKILYSLVNSLQKISFLDTKNKLLPQRSSRTAGAHDVSD